MYRTEILIILYVNYYFFLFYELFPYKYIISSSLKLPSTDNYYSFSWIL